MDGMKRFLVPTSIKDRKAGFSVEQQYTALNRARDKRKRKAQKRQKHMLAGGTGIPLIRLYPATALKGIA